MGHLSGYQQREADITRYTKKEEQFAQDIEYLCDVKLWKDCRNATSTHNYSEIDYMIIDQNKNIKGFIELQTSNNAHDTYKDYVLDHSKLAYIRTKALQTSLPIYVAVRWQDVDMIYEYNPRHSFRIQVSGRTKHYRGKFDQKEVEYIPIKKHFRRLNGDVL